MWWDGPPWLKLSPEVWPCRSDINLSIELPEIKAKVLVVSAVDTPPWTKFSSYDQLLRTVTWCRRFMRNCQCQERKGALTSPHASRDRFCQSGIAATQPAAGLLSQLSNLGSKAYLINLALRREQAQQKPRRLTTSLVESLQAFC